jgi:hypothetical protein
METILKCHFQIRKKQFDGMFDIPRLYLSACSNSVQLVPLHLIIMSILFHHYKELKECISEVERIEDKVNDNSKEKRVVDEKEEQEKTQEREGSH